MIWFQYQNGSDRLTVEFDDGHYVVTIVDAAMGNVSQIFMTHDTLRDLKESLDANLSDH